MKQKHLLLSTVFVIFALSMAACSPKTNLSIDEYAIVGLDWEGEDLIFEPLEGTREEILVKYADERSQPAATFTPPFTLGSDSLKAIERYSENLVSVDVTRNDLLVLSVESGVISPINNFRGFWVLDGHWFLEVAHVEENPTDPNAAFIIWGEIFQDGESLNEKSGYDEAFNFQILNGRPFYFFSKDGAFGYSYDGRNTTLGYTEIPHYLCCSASAFNPQAAENMVAFYASKAEQDFYVELGAFE